MKTQLLSTAVFSSSEIQIHYKRPLFDSMKWVTNALDANEILRQYIDPNIIDVKEHFYVMLLNNANRVLGISLISIGELRGTMVNIKEIFQLTLLTHADYVILAHLHPSGLLKPSDNDIEITEKIQYGLSLLDVTLLDHLIITSESFFSFANEGLL